MSNFMKQQAIKQANKLFSKQVGKQISSLTPVDPVYEELTDANGRTRRVKRDLPPGLSKRDQRILRKVKRRARRLDRGVSLCGFRVGWTFFLSLIPFVGDITDVLLNYFLVVKLARQADIPDWLLSKMLFNNTISASFSFIPLAGDIFLGVWKANSRNAMLLEHFLALRGQDNVAAAASAAGAPTTAGHGHLPSTAAGEKIVEPPTQKKKKSLKFWGNKGQPKETEKSAV